MHSSAVLLKLIERQAGGMLIMRLMVGDAGADEAIGGRIHLKRARRRKNVLNMRSKLSDTDARGMGNVPDVGV